jgi:hypothetical protein
MCADAPALAGADASLIDDDFTSPNSGPSGLAAAGGMVGRFHAPAWASPVIYWQPGTPSAVAPVCEPLKAAPTYTPQCELPVL